MGHVDWIARWDTEEALKASSQAATNPIAITLGEGLKLLFPSWISIKKAGKANLYSFLFDQAGNQTSVYRFTNMLYVYQFGLIIS